MTITFTWPTNQDNEVVDAIRSAIGRDVTFYYVASSNPCPVCNLDPVTNTSTNAFCTICSGEYWIPVYSGEIVNAHISWGYSERLGWVAGGQLDEGECRISIDYSPTNVSLVNNARWVVVDGRDMQLTGKKQYRGVKTLNRILVDLIEKEYNDE